MTVEMVDKKGPHFPNPLRSPDDGQYAQVLNKQVDVATELKYVYDAITLTRHKLKGRVPLFGFCGAPWTLLCYMVEGGGSKLFVQVKTWIYKYPQASKDLLQKIASVCVEYLALQVKAGAQVGHAPSSSLPRLTNLDCSSIRFLGSGIVTGLIQGILSSVSRIHCPSPSKTIGRAKIGRCSDGRLCQRCLVRTGLAL